MLARTGLPLQQSQCSTSTSLRAAPTALPLTRALVVAKSAQPSRSSSPRSQAWWSSWRQELEHGSHGNGNGAQVDEHVSPHLTNGNGHHHGAESNGSSWRSDRWAQEPEPQEAEDAGGYAGAWSGSTDALASIESDAPTGEEVEEESSGGGFFTDAFKEALQAALKRSPLYADEYAGMGSADEETTEPQPNENEVEVYNRPIFNDQFRQVLKDSLARQQAELDTYSGIVSDDEYTPAVPYVPAPPPRREMSPIEEIIATALGASQLHLRRLNLMKNEIEAAIERETKQMERLDFALNKTRSDLAYYQTLERMLKEQEGKRQ